jgi:hypothetical protein
MVVLLSEQQAMAIEAEADSFTPAAGAWGRGGATLMRLDRVPDSWMDRALRWAWENKAPNHLRE